VVHDEVLAPLKAAQFPDGSERKKTACKQAAGRNPVALGAASISAGAHGGLQSEEASSDMLPPGPHLQGWDSMRSHDEEEQKPSEPVVTK